MPKELQDQLHILCVLFTVDVGGIVFIYFDEDGSVNMMSTAEPDDIYYDKIGSGLKLEQVKAERRSLFEQVETWYRLFS